MFDEITRILNHLMWLGSNALDLGAMAVFLYAFREREELMDCYEAVSGARMHATYYRPGGVYRDLPDHMPKYKESPWRKGKTLKQLQRVRAKARCSISSKHFTNEFPKRVDEYETLLTDNRIWKQRTVGIGVISPEQARAWGMTGADAARFGHRLGPAQEAALCEIRRRSISTSRSASTATATTVTWCASRRCASPTGSSSNAWSG